MQPSRDLFLTVAAVKTYLAAAAKCAIRPTLTPKQPSLPPAESEIWPKLSNHGQQKMAPVRVLGRQGSPKL